MELGLELLSIVRSNDRPRSSGEKRDLADTGHAKEKRSKVHMSIVDQYCTLGLFGSFASEDMFSL